MTSLLGQARARLDEAARLAPFPHDVIEALTHAQRTEKTTLAVPLDDGTRGFFEAWYCRHDETREPLNGRLEIRPTIAMEDVEGLALLATIKGALLGLPFGAAAGGVRADPALLSAGELDRLKRCFSERLCRSIHVDGDESIAIGGFHVLQELAADLRLGPGARVSIVGFGRIGRHVARLLDRAGYAIVAASDATEAVVSHAGIQVSKLLAAKDAGVLGAVCGQRGVARQVAGAAIAADCELLVTAGRARLIHRANARYIRARVILELTDGSVDADADEILEDRGILVVPDALASAGGTAGCHPERVPDGGVGARTDNEVDDWLARLMVPAARTAWGVAQARSTSLRRATHLLALSRLAVASGIECGLDG